MGNRWFRAGQWIVGLAIVAFACRSLARNWDQLRAQPLAWRFEPAWLILSALLVWAMYALLIAAWRAMLGAWGQRLDPWAAARIWTVSSLGKYLPGKVWAVAGWRSWPSVPAWPLARRWGRRSSSRRSRWGPGRRWRGSAVSAPCGRRIPEIVTVLALLVGASAAGTALLFWPPVVRRMLRIAAPEAAAQTAAGGSGHRLRSSGERGGLDRVRRGVLVPDSGPAAGDPARSHPGGRGVHRLVPGGVPRALRARRPGRSGGVFILMLQGPLGPGAATALALASRVLLTITEFGAAVPFLAFPRGRPRVAH